MATATKKVVVKKRKKKTSLLDPMRKVKRGKDGKMKLTDYVNFGGPTAKAKKKKKKTEG